VPSRVGDWRGGSGSAPSPRPHPLRTYLANTGITIPDPRPADASANNVTGHLVRDFGHSGPPAWKTIPSWAVIGTADHVIPPAELLFMANRAHAHVTEINAGHLSLITNPDAVTRVIIDAAGATAG
jgi:pimeloyl-ACP methyl ester carboxylesterase